jgi:uncharacterized protein (TIGR00159 family)
MESFSILIRWQDVVDILLNSYILFRFYVLIRGTQVMRVIAGIALLWIFQRIAVSLGLIVTSWLLQGIIAAAALIIVIVFRNEIRSILQAKNLKAIFWELSHKNTLTPVQIIIEGVYEMTRRHMGALIVLPGAEDLDDLIQGGILWNGKISKEMLLSVFWTNNPVHDGAAIIRDQRIVRVGTILPLSEKADLPSSYGTRHRAAIGLSERSDALAIVVSEERSQVMIAKDGITYHIKDNLQLEHLLSDHLGNVPMQRDQRFRERLEFSLAGMLCLLCIIGIWFSFARGFETLINLSVPVEYMNRNTQMEIMDTSINSVNLILGGSGTLTKSLTGEQVKVKIDLDKAVAGVNTFTLTQENVVLPPGIILKNIDPAVVNVNLDKPERKVLPVQVDWVGKLKEDLIMEKVSVDPEYATLVGGRLRIENITTIYTKKIPLDNIEASGQITVKLTLHPPGLRVAGDQEEKVSVRYMVKNRLIE